MSQRRESIDTYLLKVLDILLTERSVTRTAVKLNQSQPAISTALGRLRAATGDALLVRGKGGMVPTEYALQLREPARTALREIERIRVGQRPFDPLRSTRVCLIGCPDYLSVLFVPTIVERFRQAAPDARLEFHPLGASFDYEAALEDGRLDVVIGNWPAPPEQLRRANLFADRMVCLLRAAHPLAKYPDLSVAQYLKAPHLAPTPYAIGQRSAIDLFLARERLSRRVAVALPYFNLAPYVLMRSDLIFTTTQLFAEYYSGFLPLTTRDAPLNFPPMQYYQLWHERAHNCDHVRWLRGLISDATRTLHRPGLPGD